MERKELISQRKYILRRQDKVDTDTSLGKIKVYFMIQTQRLDIGMLRKYSNRVYRQWWDHGRTCISDASQVDDIQPEKIYEIVNFATFECVRE